jgi:hypothetical protein
LYYTVTVNCGYPDLLPRVENALESAPRIEAYDDIPLKGTNITFSCPPGLVLSGPNLATCAENGRWQLDLNGLTCAITKGYASIKVQVYMYRVYFTACHGKSK